MAPSCRLQRRVIPYHDAVLSPFWWIPLAVAAAAVVPLWFVGQRVAQELAALRDAIATLHRLQPVAAEVRVETERVRRAFENLGPR
jgi:hypothetical protein